MGDPTKLKNLGHKVLDGQHLDRLTQLIDASMVDKAQRDADIAALKTASQALDKQLLEHGVDIESLLSDFKAARRHASAAP